jgi:trans-aconitate methyltransferase
MTVVYDDPLHPDPGFADLYAKLPDATDLWPWLDLAREAASPVLYLGIGAGRVAVPLHDAGIEMVGVDSHPAMLARLRQRLPDLRTVESRIETLMLEQRFRLVIAPSNILYLVERLRAAARHLDEDGSLAIELANPHWLRAGAGSGVRVRDLDGNQARLDIDYRLSDGSIVTQRAEVALVWPEEVENWLKTGAGLTLQRMFGHPEAELTRSPSFFVVAGRP